MKLADFEAEDGERIELDFTHQEIPKQVEINGKVYKRVISSSCIVIPNTFKAGTRESEFRYKKPPITDPTKDFN